MHFCFSVEPRICDWAMQRKKQRDIFYLNSIDIGWLDIYLIIINLVLFSLFYFHVSTFPHSV